jgi:serine/threonine-protein kinase
MVLLPPPAMPARTATPYEPGYMIADKYELESIIGQGGMGAVWRARNVALDSPVAIKVVRASGDRAALRGRLMQEARAAAKLAHPAIVKVFDVGQTENGDPFIVMELLTGSSLGSIIASEGTLSTVQAVRILLPIIDALWLAHGKGIVHRDIKPDNVFIVQHEGTIQPKLVDFGIVKVQAAEGSGQLTQGGVVLGSPDYMSPEQARGQDDVDLRSDIWSLCVVLYEVIASRTPFEGNNYNALLRQIVETAPSSLRQLAVADDALSAIVERGLSKQRQGRFGSMGELGRALATWLVSQGVHEDICGTTVETKWLRATDPHERPMRASMVSLNEAWPGESGSGVRPNALGPVNTVPAGEPDPAVLEPVAPAKRRALAVPIAAALVLLVLGVWYLARSSGAPVVTPSQEETAPAAAKPAQPPPPAINPPAEQAPAASAAADTEVDEKAALSNGGKVSSSSSKKRGSAKGPVKQSEAAASAQPKASPRGDLISPY